MLEDKMFLWKIKHGSSDALCRVYEKYKKDMFSLANALLHDHSAAEDVVHDVFVSFVQSVAEFKLTGSLKGYLLTCVANLSRDKVRAKKRSPQSLYDTDLLESNYGTPSQTLITAEQLHRLRDAIVKLPYEQREAVILHLQTGRTFRQIAQLQQASVSTIQSRYRYGLEKLRTLLNSEINNEAHR
jgi:RNA polymerase sigma factor (sigma-70 family)